MLRNAIWVVGASLWLVGCGGSVVLEGAGTDSDSSGENPDNPGNPDTPGNPGTPVEPSPGVPTVPDNLQPDCYNGEPLYCGSADAVDHQENVASSYELHVVGVYETQSQHSFECSPVGGFSVHVTRKGTHALFLSTYEPAYWVVTTGEGVTISHVILSGYGLSSASVPNSTKLENLSGEDIGGDLPSGYEWPSDESKAMAVVAEDLTGASFSSFHGGYCRQSVVIQ
ncbi:MAG: hypothetical protein IPK82_27285 [Polyangiaceae bacterium]|nr:hypothetical protein [Polyangiaceae bacterium]